MNAIDSSQQLLAELRHDLANPLNHVLGFTELLMRDVGQRAPQREVRAGLEELTRFALEMRRHLEEHLGMARIRARQVNLPALRTGISGGAEQVLAKVEALRPLVAGGWAEGMADLEEVKNAADRLRQMVAPGALERVLPGMDRGGRA